MRDPIRNTEERRTALFISPHLDDIAFSCGGTLAKLARQGCRVTLATVFTRSVADPHGFALECQLDKGLPPDADYMDLRRAEDREFAGRIGVRGGPAVEVLHLDHAEAPHRGYGNASSLFGGVHEDDLVFQEIAEDLASLLLSRSPDVVFAPQGLGGHVDHLQTIKAVRSVLEERRKVRSLRVFWFRDAPYATRLSDAARPWLPPDGAEETAFYLRYDDLERKLHACEAYATQLGFQFGGIEKMRESLTDFAAEEARRIGLDDGDFAETFLTNTPANTGEGTV